MSYDMHELVFVTSNPKNVKMKSLETWKANRKNAFIPRFDKYLWTFGKNFIFDANTVVETDFCCTSSTPFSFKIAVNPTIKHTGI